MNLPIAVALAAFAAGATLLQWAPRLPPLPGGLALVATSLVAAAWRLAQARHGNAQTRERLLHAAAVGLAGLLAGFFYAAWRAESRLSDALAPEWETRDIRIAGVVDDLPQNGVDGARFAFAIERVATAHARVPHRVSLAWHAKRADDAGDSGSAVVPVVHAGERWRLVVRLKRSHGNVNPDGFDLEAWLLEHDLRATGYVRDDPSNVRVASFAGRAGDYVQRARERIRERIEAAVPGAPYAGVLIALAIGDQRAIPESQWAVFNRTGITHLVSISGLHVTVFATLAGGLAFACARRSAALTLRVPARKIAAAIGALAAFGYVLLAGAEVPAVRTLWMLLVAAIGLWIGRPGTATLVWLWSLVAVVAWDPWAGLAPGFWLSFGAVGLLLYAGTGRMSRPQRASRWSRWQEAVREASRAQWVVTIGLVPGTLALFQQVSIVSALANAVAIPVVTLAVVPLALSGIVIPFDFPWPLAHAVLAALMRYLEWLSALPVATWTSHAPRGWTVVVAIAGILWMVAPRGVPGRALGALWMLPMAALPPAVVPEGGARVVVLDVGQGLAVVVATAHHALVYDAGPRFNDTVDAGGRIIVPYLRAAGIGAVDALVVSHADSDHSGGALSILRAVPVAQLISSLPGDHPIVASAHGGPRTRCEAGARWTWDGVAFEILHPARIAYDDAARKSNDFSCVLRVRSAGGTLLLTGDIEALSETEMIARDPGSLRADVLVVPHHGSRTSSTTPFIDAVAPRIAIVAAGYRNRFGHPRGDVIARYSRAGATRPRTDLLGAISVVLDPRQPISAIGERERRPRYWYDAASG
jgi:competence protein ComEC